MKLYEQIYIGGAVVVALVACVVAAVPTVPTANQLLVLWMMVVLAAIAQFFEVKITEQRSYFPHNVFFFAGVLLLPPLLLPVLFAIPLLLEGWRYYWRGQTHALANRLPTTRTVTVPGASHHDLFTGPGFMAGTAPELRRFYGALPD